MSDIRDRQANSSDRGPPAAVENLHPTYGLSNTVDGAGMGQGSYGARDVDGRGGPHDYARPSAGRIWDDRREKQGASGGGLHVPSGRFLSILSILAAESWLTLFLRPAQRKPILRPVQTFNRSYTCGPPQRLPTARES
jgi:hypothetical protein